MQRLKSSARVTEVDDTSDRIVTHYQQMNPVSGDTKLAALISDISTESAQITEAIKQDVRLSELDVADARRDTGVKRVGNVLTGYASMMQTPLVNAATRLSLVFDKYGVEITRANYVNESSLIEAMLQDFAAPALAADIAALPGLEDVLTELRNAQTEFRKRRTEYEQFIAQGHSAETATTLKKRLTSLINDRLVPYLEAMMRMDAAGYKPFADAVAQAIEDTNDVIRRRAQAAAAAKAKAEQQQQTTPPPAATPGASVTPNP